MVLMSFCYMLQYQADEPVTLWVNKVGPYNNPQETYNYYSLPFCHPGDGGHKWGGLGEVLGGNELIDSRIDIKFKRDVEKSTICELVLDAAKVAQFKDAIESSYWFEFFMDDLPLWGFVGEVLPDRNRDTKHVLYTHKNFLIQYNKDQIIHVNLTQETPKPLEEGRLLGMTYSVKWVPTNITYERRFDVYLDYPFFEHQIHWFSVFNSFMMVIFLTGLVSMILMRTLRNDYAKYAREDDDLESLERDVNEESGWKLVHGDVFRPPQNLALLSAVVGTGAQLTTLVLLVIIFAIIGMLYIGRGAITTTFIVCYALTSFIAGYVSGGLYSRNGGKKWIKSMILTASLFPFMCFGIGFILNTIAIFYGSLAAIPFGTMVVVFVIWAFISFPLALLGTVVGRNWSGTPNNPCRVKTIPRPIPEKKWYLTPSVISLMGGLLPFGSIFIEMYFVFTSFWNYKVYYVYGFMLLVFIILIIVTVCVTIVGTYFLLNAENYHWRWTSFFSAASTALYVYLYAIYYYHVKTKMSGFFQTSFYFGYTMMFCLGLGILCAGFLTPNKKEDVVLVVEFDQNQEEATSVLPNIGHGIASPYVNQHQQNSARDVAFGKCKEKITSVFGKTKDKVEEGFTKVSEKAKDVVDTTKSKKDEVMEQVKGEISEKAEEGKKDLKDIIVRGRDFFRDVFTYIFSLGNLRHVMRLMHLLGFSVAYGMCIWVTFVSSYVLARALPRQQFAVVQSKIYPVYFKAMAYCVGLTFIGHFLSQKRRPYASLGEAVQGFNLLASISMLLVNFLYLEPRATKVMFERLKLEKEEGRGSHIFNIEPSSTRGVESVLDPTKTTTTKPAEKSPEQSAAEVVKPQVVKLSQKLKKLNSHSSFLNVLTLMALTHHLVHLTQILDAAT
ncbi:hypothetical protein KY284_009155 [Solanum tuberosum]|nr:hypothetical protein KY284_009155 [Solanum tuberosum]